MPLNSAIENKILDCLREASFDIQIAEIARRTVISRGTVSKYLAVYVDRGTVIETRGVGRAKMYRLSSDHQPAIDVSKQGGETGNSARPSSGEAMKRLEEIIQTGEYITETQKKLAEMQRRFPAKFRYRVKENFAEGVTEYRKDMEYVLEVRKLGDAKWLEDRLKERKIELIDAKNQE